nr:APC family permease [Pseudomonas aeruginosa]
MDDNKNKVLRLRDVVLYTVSAMLFMDQIALASSLGPSSLFWWLYVLVLLFLPMAMMTSELGTAFPANGGVYHWVRSAFGFRWGARVSWMYWVNNALWMPSVYTLFGSMLGAFYFPELSLWGKIAIGIALALLTAAFNVVALRLGKWLPNLGALLKLLAVLALGVGGLHHGWNHGFANDFSLDSIVPSSPGQMAALGVMVYGIMGTELACCSAAEMRNARRDIPRAVLISGLIVGAFNIFGTLGVLAAVPAEETDVTRIFAHTLYNIYGHDGAGGMLADLVGAFVLFTLFTNMVTWSMGTNRAAVEAAKAGAVRRGPFAPRHADRLGGAGLGGEHRPAAALRPGGAHCRGTVLDPAVDLRHGFHDALCADVPGLRPPAPRRPASTALPDAAGRPPGQSLGAVRRAACAGRHLPVRRHPRRADGLGLRRQDRRRRGAGPGRGRTADPPGGAKARRDVAARCLRLRSGPVATAPMALMCR